MEKTCAVEVIRSRMVTETTTVLLATEDESRVREFAVKLAHTMAQLCPDGYTYTVTDETSEYESGTVKELTDEEVAQDKADLLARGCKRGFVPHVD
jgi:hypothetical protein